MERRGTVIYPLVCGKKHSISLESGLVGPFYTLQSSRERTVGREIGEENDYDTGGDYTKLIRVYLHSSRNDSTLNEQL